MNSHGKGTRTLEDERKAIDLLLQRVRVDVKEGRIFWTNPKARRLKPGDEAGTMKKGGYWEIKFDDLNYRRHRIVYYVATGKLPVMVDHKHGTEMGDGIDNLQEIENRQNTWKQRKRCDNVTGYRGVVYHKGSRKYYASIGVNGKRIHIGSYDTPELASIAYEERAKVEFGQFYRGLNE